MAQIEERVMDIEEIKRTVSDIEAMAGDPEAAHCLEDSLMQGFIIHVSGLDLGGLSDMASEVLKTRDIDFPRWRA